MAILDEALYHNLTKTSNLVESTINSNSNADNIQISSSGSNNNNYDPITTTWSTLISSSLSDLESSESQYTPYNERPETYIVPIVFAIIFVVGVLGNGTLVIVFLRHRNMRNMPNTYILSLALADLLVIVTCVPFTSTVYTLESWPWGEAVCKLSECAKDISIGVSVFTLTALSAERYCAIVNPLRRFQTKPLTVFSAIFIWLLAILCALPGAIVSNVEEIPLSINNSILVCSPFPPGDFHKPQYYAKYNVVAKALIYYILPLFVIAFFYGLMAHRLHISARDMPGELAGAQSVAQARARRHVARMVLAFILVFFICFLPYHVFMLWFHLHPTSKEDFDENWNILRIVGFCLSFIHSCVNPVALYCVSGVFRQYFNLYLCCRDTRRVSQRGGQPSINMNCETSFNSTFRRHTQITQDAFTTDTTAGGINNKQSIYRKQYLARQNTQNTSILSLDTTNNHTNRVLNNKDGNGMVDFNDIDIMRKSMIDDHQTTIITDEKRCRSNGNTYGS